jgi:hypothetical protein
MNKCDLLKRAAKPYGIEPQLDCVATQTEFCMETVQVDAADVMTTQPDDLYVAYRYIIVISSANLYVICLTTYVTAQFQQLICFVYTLKFMYLYRYVYRYS